MKRNLRFYSLILSASLLMSQCFDAVGQDVKVSDLIEKRVSILGEFGKPLGTPIMAHFVGVDSQEAQLSCNGKNVSIPTEFFRQLEIDYTSVKASTVKYDELIGKNLMILEGFESSSMPSQGFLDAGDFATTSDDHFFHHTVTVLSSKQPIKIKESEPSEQVASINITRITDGSTSLVMESGIRVGSVCEGVSELGNLQLPEQLDVQVADNVFRVPLEKSIVMHLDFADAFKMNRLNDLGANGLRSDFFEKFFSKQRRVRFYYRVGTRGVPFQSIENFSLMENRKSVQPLFEQKLDELIGSESLVDFEIYYEIVFKAID